VSELASSTALITLSNFTYLRLARKPVAMPLSAVHELHVAIMGLGFLCVHLGLGSSSSRGSLLPNRAFNE